MKRAAEGEERRQLARYLAARNRLIQLWAEAGWTQQEICSALGTVPAVVRRILGLPPPGGSPE